MARLKLSEFRAKSLLYGALGQSYRGVEISKQDMSWLKRIQTLESSSRYVVKVDQGVKGRFKKGLVRLNLTKKQLLPACRKLFTQGFEYLLIEPYQAHDANSEQYLAIERTRDGLKLSFSLQGGIDIEAQADTMQSCIYDPNISEAQTPFPGAEITKLIALFDDSCFSFLEVNPMLVLGDTLVALDAAVEVDGAASFFVESWSETDIRSLPRHVTQEQVVRDLSTKSQASFALESIQPNGSIFLLLSGGGASVVVADEISNLGYGASLGNYGEYSGNPNLEETALYTTQVLELMLASKATPKVLIIGGAVANFTDIRQTFKGIVQAIEACKPALLKQKVRLYVRRGGPHEKEGLASLGTYLSKVGIPHEIHGPELMLTDIVDLAVQGLRV